MASRSICKVCQGISVDTIYETKSRSGVVEHGGYPHHESIEALQESAQSCPVCNWIFTATEYPLHKGASLSGRGFTKQVHLNCEAKPQPPRALQRGKIMYLNGNVGQVIFFDVCARSDDPLALSGDVIGRPIPEDPMDLLAVNTIQRWLNLCQSSHTTCDSLSSFKEFPTRVLRIIDDETVVLQDYEPFQDGNYSALSYCWGPSQGLMLNSDNKKQLRSPFRVDTLSRTAQDFIKVCRVIGIEFGWIDALCIIQGDSVDWNRESVKMGAIYRNAHVTIAADAAAQSSDGFLQPRLQANSARVQSRTSTDGKQGELIFRASDTRKGRFDSFLESPVSDRAWCFQEQVLSRRIIHFCKDQTFWECEDSAGVWPEDNISDDVTTSHSTAKKIVSGKNHKTERLIVAWQHVFVRFSNRKMTYESDTLTALTGIAHAFADLMGANPMTDYLAGIWRQDLHQSLLWETKLRAKDNHKKEYCGPSWSWASVYSLEKVLGFETRKISPHYTMPITSTSLSLVSDLNPLGAVSSGYLRSDGCRMRALPLLGQVATPDDGAYYLYNSIMHSSRFYFDEDSILGEIKFDDATLIPSGKVWTVVVCSKMIDSEDLSYFLALTSAEDTRGGSGEVLDGSDIFRRVGTGWARSEWFFSVEGVVRNISIV